jgi:PPOX class probable F420-dependent enzyme
VRLPRDEAWAVLAASHTGIFTTLRSDGTAIALPVWFVVFDERIYVAAPSTTKKVVRVARDPRVSFLVESGQAWADLRAVHVTGTARIVSDAAQHDRVMTALDAKYAEHRTPRAAMPDATRAHYEVPSTVIEITPDDRILSWDNRRLRPAD